MRTKFCSVLLALIAGIGTMFADKVQIGNLYYNLDTVSLTAEVTSMPSGKYSGNITIPSSVNYESVAYVVASIGSAAFSSCTGMTSISIPNSVTSIGSSAFYKCTGLTSVYITDLATWCAISFENSTANPLYNARNLYLNDSQITELVISDGITSIGDYAFARCSSLTSVTISNSVTNIGKSAFLNCSGLTSLTIGNSVSYIGDNAFSNCYGLISVTIPNSVIYVGRYAFYHCPDLKSVTIGNGITNIGSEAFGGCTSLTSIVIPNSVTSIEEKAFLGCSSLSFISIPSSVISIGYKAFDGCSKDVFITIDANNTKYDSRGNCNAIIETATNTLIMGFPSTIIPNSVTCIGECAFRQCEGLSYLSIPNSVTSIMDSAFFMCDHDLIIEFTSSTPPIFTNTCCFRYTACKFVVPCGSKSAYESALNSSICGDYTIDTSRVTDVHLKHNVSSIDPTMGDVSVIQDPTCTNPIWKFQANAAYGYRFIGWSDGNIDNPRAITLVQDSTIYANFEVTDSVNPFVGFEANNTLIDQINNENLIQNLVNVTVVQTPDQNYKHTINLINSGEGTFTMGGVTFSFTNDEAGKIAYKTYDNYIQPNGLEREVRIPTTNGEQVKVVLVEACNDILVNGVSRNFVAGDNILTATGSSIVLKNNSAKPKISAIVPFDGGVTPEPEPEPEAITGTCGKNLTWELLDGILTISGAGDMYNYGVQYWNYPPWYEDGDDITQIIINDGVTSIGWDAFYDCTNLTSVIIPNSITSIGNGAFKLCKSLTSVTIPNSVTIIEGGAFSDCYSLISVTIPNSVKTIGGSAFRECTSLISVTIPNSVTSIGKSVFYHCTSLTSVTIPNSVKTIGEYAFSTCTSLTSVNIPNGVSYIEGYTFYKCTSLTSVYIPYSVRLIREKAFYGCEKITNLTCKASTPPELHLLTHDGSCNVFEEVNKSIPLYVPTQSITAYKNAEGWKEFQNILPIKSQDMEEIVGNNSPEGKVIYDGQIFILRGERVYNAQGALVK